MRGDCVETSDDEVQADGDDRNADSDSSLGEANSPNKHPEKHEPDAGH